MNLDLSEFMLMIHEEKFNQDAAEFCKLFLGDRKAPRYVLGRNEYAASIARQVNIDGFIDDYATDTEFMGKPIVGMSSVPRDSLVVSAVNFVVPLTALANLRRHGLTCLDYFSFFKYSGLAVKDIVFLTESRRHIQENREGYRWLYERLHDGESRRILKKLVNFRMTGELEYLAGFENNQAGQYFEPFLELCAGEVFVDAGGFDGQTVIDFAERCPSYKSVHFFEPDPGNLAVARSRLVRLANISYYKCGLGETRDTLKFHSGGGSASSLGAEGNMEIQVDLIDRLINEPVTWIKMDIEGAERPALRGAGGHIQRDYPKLAICCYHRFDDLLKIPEEVFAIRDDYTLYLRHYTEGTQESVMYFLPRG